MPASPLALLLYLALLIPGLAYVLIWERRAPHRRPSAFRETATVVFVSVLAELATLLLLAIFAARFPESIPDVNLLVRQGDKYAAPHWVSLTWWGLGMLTASTLLASGAALAVTRRPHTSTQSAWWRMFEGRRLEIAKEYGLVKDEVAVEVCCLMADGVQVQGTLAWFNQLSDDIADRDLLLVGPLTFTSATGQAIQPRSHAVCLSAREIKRTQVRYVIDQDAVPVSGLPPAPSAGPAIGSGAKTTAWETPGSPKSGPGQATGTGWPALT